MSSFKKATIPVCHPAYVTEDTSVAAEQQGAVPQLPGTRRWIDGTLLISTGHSTLDSLIGGGIPVGSILCLESDGTSALSSTFSALYLAEGIAAGHDIVVGHQEDTSCAEILRTLPFNLSAGSRDSAAVVTRATEFHERSGGQQSQQPLVLAAAYNKYLRSEPTGNDVKYCHTFDLNRNVPLDSLPAERVTDWRLDEAMLPPQLPIARCNVNRLYMHHLGKGDMLGPCAQLHAVAGQFTNSAARCIGGAFGFDGCDPELSGDEHGGVSRASRLKAQVMGVRRLIQMASTTVCLLHLNSTIIPTPMAAELRALCDIVLKVHSFSDPMCSLSLGGRFSGQITASVVGIAKEYSDCHGLLQVRKLVRPGCLSTGFRDDALTYTLKRDRKKLIVEKPHLPPEHNTLPSDVSNLACASNTTSAVEF